MGDSTNPDICGTDEATTTDESKTTDEATTTDESKMTAEALTKDEYPITYIQLYELEDLQEIDRTKKKVNQDKVDSGKKDFTYIMIILLLVLLNCICCNCCLLYRSKGTIKHERESIV